jgi:hypothetical protein
MYGLPRQILMATGTNDIYTPPALADQRNSAWINPPTVRRLPSPCDRSRPLRASIAAVPTRVPTPPPTAAEPSVQAQADADHDRSRPPNRNHAARYSRRSGIGRELPRIHERDDLSWIFRFVQNCQRGCVARSSVRRMLAYFIVFRIAETVRQRRAVAVSRHGKHDLDLVDVTSALPGVDVQLDLVGDRLYARSEKVLRDSR